MARRLLVVAVAAAAFGASLAGVYLLGQRSGERAPMRRAELPAVAEARALSALPRPRLRTPEEEIGSLRAAAGAGSPMTRSTALTALSSRAPAQALELAREQLGDPALAAAAAGVLLRAGQSAPVAARLDQPGLDAETRRAIAGQLLEKLVATKAPSAEAVAARLGADPDPQLRELMTRRLARLGSAAIERLCKPLTADPDSSVREAARAMLRAAARP